MNLPSCNRLLVRALSATLIWLPSSWPAHAADNPTAGAGVFKEQCADCHTVTPGKNKRGPSLAGIVGKPAASVASYNYSDAMRTARITWTPERLGTYLAAPKTALPGTKMRLLAPPTASEIADVISYLQGTK